MSSSFPGIMRIPSWSVHPWLRAGFSTRLGGESTIYGTCDLNLGWTASDDSKTVARNREHFLAAAGANRDTHLVTARQFHSNLIRQVSSIQAEPMTAYAPRGDALMTDVAGLFLGIQTADCVPVLAADTRQHVVAAFHAGWRGTLERIVERGIGDLQLRYSSQPENIVAAIGPSIQACCFIVGRDVRSKFVSQFRYADELFRKSAYKEASRLDLVAANRRQLLDAGIPKANISLVGECTSCARIGNSSRKYFSHRAEHGFTGRMLSVIGMTV